MDLKTLEKRFREIGANVICRTLEERRRPARIPVFVNVRRSGGREFFELDVHPDAVGNVVDARPDMRHLLLHSRMRSDTSAVKVLCGHDERHWFAARIPTDRGVTNVVGAMDALKPLAVVEAENIRKLSAKERRRRRNAAYVRQGEWYFVPAPNVAPSSAAVRREEPMQRDARSKPHIAEFAYRQGGEVVWVSHLAPRGITATERERLVARRPEARKVPWIQMRRNPELYIRGRVRHPDHATISLVGWHRVYMNEEGRVLGNQSVVFLD